jgi:hypothetical protein
VPLLEGLYVKTRYNLPSWTQFELLQEVIQMFNLSLQFEGSIVKITHNVVDEFVNISDIIASRSPKTDNDIYAIRNHFKYNNSDSGNFILGYESETLEKNFVELKSDSSKDVVNSELASAFNLGNVKIYNLTNPVNTDVEDRISVEPRFLLAAANPFPAQINASKLLLFAGLSFADLYSEFYSTLYDFLQNSKSITYQAKLTYNKFLEILSKKGIYDEVLGRELTVLQINKFNPNRLTEIKAITRETNG